MNGILISTSIQRATGGQLRLAAAAVTAVLHLLLNYISVLITILLLPANSSLRAVRGPHSLEYLFGIAFKRRIWRERVVKIISGGVCVLVLVHVSVWYVGVEGNLEIELHLCCCHAICGEESPSLIRN
jgi:hypothetical protein